MMDREQALQWLVDNLKVWPEPSEDENLLPNCYLNGWLWIAPDFNVVLADNNWLQRITEQDWRSAQPAPVSNDEEWIDNDGSGIPVHGDVEVEVKMASGHTCTGMAENFLWPIINCSGDIKQYRILSDAPASNKPNWDDAPDGANIVVCTAIGTWYWGSYKNAEVRGKHWHGVGDGKWIGIAEVPEIANPNWRDTLEHRPVAEGSMPVDMRQASGIDAGVVLDAHVHKNIVCTPKEEIAIRERRAVFGRMSGIELDARVNGRADPSQEEKRDAVLAQLSKNLIRTKELKSSIALTEINLDLMLKEQDKLSRDISDVLLHFGY